MVPSYRRGRRIEDASGDAPPPPSLVDGFAFLAKPLWLSFAFDLEGRTEFEHIRMEKSLEGLKKAAGRQRKGQRRPEEAPRRPRGANKGPQQGQKRAQVVKTWPQNRPKRPKNDLERAEKGPKRQKNGPKNAKKGPERPNKAPTQAAHEPSCACASQFIAGSGGRPHLPGPCDVKYK